MSTSLLIGSWIKGIKNKVLVYSIPMPSAARSDKWFFRVTLPHDVVKIMLQQALHTVKLIDMTRMLVVGHNADKEEKRAHVHGLFELSKVLQKQSIDVRLKSIFGVSGSDYSSKPWDGGMEHGAGSYMYHDPSAIEIFNKGFTDAQIARFRECNQQVQEVVEENKSRASGRCVERTLKLIKDSNRSWTRAEIAMKLLEDVRDDKMYECGDFVMRKYIEEIYMKQLEKDMWLTYANARVANLVRQEDVELFSPL